MKLIGYIRVSTAQQANQGDSLDVQRDKITCYCELHDHVLVDTYEDIAASGKDLQRRGLRAALEALEGGAAAGLVVFKLDRLTRSTADLGRLLERFEERSIALQAVAESLDTSTAAGRMVVRMLGVVAEWERETIGERTSAALQAKAANGEYTGGGIPYGYVLADDGSTLNEDPQEQQVIESIRAYRAAGMTLSAIADRLEDLGYENREGRPFNPATISRISKREGGDA